MKNNAPRLVIYGIGQYGQYIVRFAHQKGWPIVAVLNRAGEKVGQNAGRLAGLDEDLGVVVEDCDTFDYSKLDADAAIVTTACDRLAENFPIYERLFGAGLNVVDHTGEGYYPFHSVAGIAEKIDALAKQHGVTYTGTGIWDMSRIWSGLLAAGPCTDIDSLTLYSNTDASRYGAHLVKRSGATMTPEEFRNTIGKDGGQTGNLYRMVMENVLTALGYTIKTSVELLEPAILDEPVYCPALKEQIPAGRVCGTRITCKVETEEGVTGELHHEGRVFREGEKEHMQWKVEGMPSTLVRVEREDSAHFTAASLFNRVRDVIAAEPGIVLVSQMAPLKHSALEGVNN